MIAQCFLCQNVFAVEALSSNAKGQHGAPGDDGQGYLFFSCHDIAQWWVVEMKEVCLRMSSTAASLVSRYF